MRLALAQINTTVGDLDGNRSLILDAARGGPVRRSRPRALPGARRHRLPARGPPPAARRSSARRGGRSTRSRRRRPGSQRSSAFPTSTATCTTRAPSAPTARVQAIYHKRFLPNYGVFDEERYFASGRDLLLLRLGEALVGVTICEDMWQPGPPATDLALAGAQLLVNVSASPFHVGKEREREEMFQQRARDTSSFVAFVNAVGGQDELIFDGHSVVLDDEGEVLARAPGFEEALLVVDVDPTAAIGRRLSETPAAGAGARAGRAARRSRSSLLGARHGVRHLRCQTSRSVAPLVDDLEQMRLALELGLRDYVDKNGFARRRRRPLRRDRLGADRGARGRGARRRARPRRLDAVPLLVRRHAGRRAAARREPRDRLPRDADRRGGRPSSRTRSRRASATWSGT